MKYNSRFLELDSLRGIAAITVLLHHFLLVQPAFYSPDRSTSWVGNLFRFSPIHILFAGHEAVVFFFILSGFVLSLPFLKGSQGNYSSYLIKRICRIYLPYLVAIAISISIIKLVDVSQRISEFSEWFNGSWKSSLTPGLLINHLLMLGSFSNEKIDPVIWSLVIEMRVSIFFPLLMLIVTKRNWLFGVVLALFLSVAGTVLTLGSKHVLHYENDYFLTLHYAAMFIIGALLAKHRNEIIQMVKSLKTAIKIFALFLSILAYTYTWWFMPGMRIIHLTQVNDWVIAIGVTIMIVLSLSSIRLSTILKLKPIHFLGEISYSLYLYHCIILLLYVNTLHNYLNLNMIYLLALVSALVVSSGMYYLVERTSINLGKSIAGRIEFKFKVIKHNIPS